MSSDALFLSQITQDLSWWGLCHLSGVVSWWQMKQHVLKPFAGNLAHIRHWENVSSCCFVLFLGFEHSLSQIPTIVSEMLYVVGAWSQQASRWLGGWDTSSPGRMVTENPVIQKHQRVSCLSSQTATMATTEILTFQGIQIRGDRININTIISSRNFSFQLFNDGSRCFTPESSLPVLVFTLQMYRKTD